VHDRQQRSPYYFSFYG
jgi:NAD(P)-dependent dehydrogenase (short-subunit alcohol dehydrogenase family)